MTYLKGEFAALSTAFLYAVASVIWSRIGERIPPLELNLIKGIIAILFLILTLLLQGLITTSNLEPVAVGLLLLSGSIGIGLGDTAFFAALNNLGPRKTLLLNTLTSPLVALLALIFLQEHLKIGSVCGILLTVLGVAWVVSERVAGNNAAPNHLLPGISWAMVSILADASGTVLSRAALSQTNINPLWSTLLRLTAGVIALMLFLLVKGRFSKQKTLSSSNLIKVLSPRLLGVITVAAFIGAYLGIWLQQVALKEAQAGIAQTLIATSPLFVIPIAIWTGEVVSKRAILGAVVALIGVRLLFSMN